MWPVSISVHREGRAGSQTKTESRGPQKSHLPRPACPVGPKPRDPQVLRPLHSPSFCLLFLPSCSIQQLPQQPVLPLLKSWRPPFREAVTGRPSTCHVLSAHLKILLLPAWATKKGAAPGPLAPCGPEHKRVGNKDIFWDGRCWCRIPPRVHRAEERRGWVSSGSTDMQGQECRQGPSGGEAGAAGT